MWAFFNRRGLVRQWKRKTDGLTEADIKNKFHRADINGDGRLNPKEFRKLLKSFGMELSASEIEILIDRFDLDGDGDIDLTEFRAFIESEQKNLFEAESGGTRRAQTALPAPKTTRYKSGSADDTATASRGGGAYAGAPRPASAPRGRPLTASAGAAAALPREYHAAPRSEYKGSGAQLSKSVQIRAPYEESTGPSQAQRDRPHMTYPRPAVAGSRRPTTGDDEGRHDEEAKYEGGGDWRMDSIGAAVADMRPLAEDPSSPHRRGVRSSEEAEEVADEDVDVLWVSRMLQAQAEVEARLGKKYFS